MTFSARCFSLTSELLAKALMLTTSAPKRLAYATSERCPRPLKKCLIVETSASSMSRPAMAKPSSRSSTWWFCHLDSNHQLEPWTWLKNSVLNLHPMASVRPNPCHPSRHLVPAFTLAVLSSNPKTSPKLSPRPAVRLPKPWPSWQTFGERLSHPKYIPPRSTSRTKIPEWVCLFVTVGPTSQA